MKHLTAIPQLLVVVWLLLLPPSLLVLCRELMPPPNHSVPSAMGLGLGTAAEGRPPHCQLEKCGDVTIPFPFGIGEGCPWKESFTIHCNHSHSPPRPYYRSYDVTNITVDTGEMLVVTNAVGHICYDSRNTTSGRGGLQVLNFSSSPFLISPERNEFTGIGCHTLALLRGEDGDDDTSYVGGCLSTCTRQEDAAAVVGQNCTGRACCKATALPSGLSLAYTGWSGRNYTNPTWEFSRCSYSFVAQKDWYKFKLSDLNGNGETAFHTQFHETGAPLVLNWVFPKEDAHLCVSEHANSTDVEGGNFICKCKEGYRGNPYSNGNDGCTDINECDQPGFSGCPKHSKCINAPGGHDCKCKFWRRKIDGECQQVLSTSTIVLSATFAGIILLVLILWLARKAHKMRIQKGYFSKNGGEILKRMNIKMFTELELLKITNDYSHPIGSGAFGDVFMGTTSDNRRVAVKRSVVASGHPNPWRGDHEMVNEIAVQFWVKHANLVRLVGCCLETDVPMLVYEYISNGSLENMLHGGDASRALPLPTRLDIAVGAARALAYMHSHEGHDLVHGDVKSGNILLGDNLTPKVSDFGTSTMVSVTRDGNWCVHADRSYLDPVYEKTGCYTEKSDVYSFGVVLLELITRKKAMYRDGDRSLPIAFVRSCKEDGNGRAMYDRDIFSAGEDDDDAQSAHRYMECLDRIGALAVRCLEEDVDARPTMAEVVEELKLAKVTACGGSSAAASDDAISENHIEEASKACMLMSMMSLRQQGRSQRVRNNSPASGRRSGLINSNNQRLSIDLAAGSSRRPPLTPRTRPTPRRHRVASPLAPIV